MVKGISRQVILVHSPDKKLFEQAIFILRDDAREVTEEMLLKEAERAIRFPQVKEKWCGVCDASMPARLPPKSATMEALPSPMIS